MSRTLFHSGTYRTWLRSREIYVSRCGCKRILIRGLAEALRDSKRTSTEIILITYGSEIKPDRVITDYKYENDRIILKESLTPGLYCVQVKIIYSDLEAPKWV